MKGNLKIKKTSSDGKVEGFTFRITGVNGYDSTFRNHPVEPAGKKERFHRNISAIRCESGGSFSMLPLNN